MVTSEAMGFTGGIWLLWDDTILDVSILSSNDQVITVAIHGGKYVDWVFLALYASPRKCLRDALWLYLQKLGRLITMSWLLVGDFNQVLHPDEKRGGRPITSTQTLSMWEMVDDCQLVDLGFSGPKFTWTNNRVGSARIRERLDRAFCNQSWRQRFLNHGIRHLPRIGSDHHPILITPAPVSVPSLRHTSFKMLDMWYRHPTFESLIQQIWQEGREQLATIHPLLVRRLQDWNYNVFGNIFYQKNRCKARLAGIHLALSKKESRYLSQLESTLLGDGGALSPRGQFLAAKGECTMAHRG